MIYKVTLLPEGTPNVVLCNVLDLPTRQPDYEVKAANGSDLHSQLAAIRMRSRSPVVFARVRDGKVSVWE
jgi:hypothetical protein